MAFIEAASPHTMNTYGRLPIALERGDGCYVWDVNGKRYLDALAGIAVNTLGHNHPKLVPALQDQVARMIHSCNYYHVPNQEKLAAKLAELSGMTNVFFCSTGLEANEAAIKLARKYGHDKGIERPEIVVYEKAFHGRSIATLSATGNERVQKGFGPLVEGFIRVPLNDIDAVKKATEGNPNVVAVFFETIQGEGGINPMRAEYLQGVRALCDANDWLMMIDEVQCGMGRTGKWFAHQWAGIKPDVMPLAKGLGSGVPIGAVVLSPDGEVIGRGRNVREADHDPTGHAEVVALREAARARGEWRLDGCSLVVTLEPCTMCAGAIVLARIQTLVFGAYDDKAGAVGSLWDVVRDRRLNHRPEVVAGVAAGESTALLADFFAGHRL